MTSRSRLTDGRWRLLNGVGKEHRDEGYCISEAALRQMQGCAA